MENTSAPEAKCGTVVACLAVIIAGQGWLLRDLLARGPASWPLPVYGELFFCAVMLAAVIWCWFHPRGWTNNRGCIAAFVFLGVYLVYQLIFFGAFSEYYLAGIHTEFPSVSRALVAVKMVLALMAVVAGIPAAPAPTGREYAEKLRQAVYKQEAGWARGTAAGAKKDLDSALAKLKANLSEEEMNALMAELRAQSENSSAAPAESITEDWRGWSGGV